jgi:hypothetical protein
METNPCRGLYSSEPYVRYRDGATHDDTQLPSGTRVIVQGTPSYAAGTVGTIVEERGFCFRRYPIGANKHAVAFDNCLMCQAAGNGCSQCRMLLELKNMQWKIITYEPPQAHHPLLKKLGRGSNTSLPEFVQTTSGASQPAARPAIGDGAGPANRLAFLETQLAFTTDGEEETTFNDNAIPGIGDAGKAALDDEGISNAAQVTLRSIHNTRRAHILQQERQRLKLYETLRRGHPQAPFKAATVQPTCSGCANW